MLESRPMMRPGCAVTTAALLGTAAGCSTSREPPPGLARVDPDSAYNDDPFSMTIDARSPFRPSYRIDVGSGSGSTDGNSFGAFLDPSPGSTASDLVRVPASAVTLTGESQLLAALPAQIAAGRYDVVVIDARGARTTLPGAFLSLGTDRDPPTVSIDEPAQAAPIGAGTAVAVSFSADDGLGHLAALPWKVFRVGSASPIAAGACAPPGEAAVGSCTFFFAAPSFGGPDDQLSIEVEADDSRGNVGTAAVTVDLLPPPVTASVAPTTGPASGGTRLIAEGADFVPDATQIFVDETPLATESCTATTISAFTVNHDPGQALVTVRTGGAASAAWPFLFVAAPLIREVLPARGAPGGGTPVSIIGNNFQMDATEVAFVAKDGSRAPLRCATFRGPSRIDGYAPAGSGTAGVVASDPVAGDGELEAAFVYDDAISPGLAPDAGCPEAGTAP